MTHATDAWRPVEIFRIRDGARSPQADHAATEAPLEIRLQGQPFVITMRTPGADEELAAGFLLSEGVITGAGDLGAMVTEADTDDAAGIVDVALKGAALARLPQLLASKRQVTATSACGVCGRATIASLATNAPPIESSWTIASPVLVTLPERLRGSQSVFDQTGGLHAAGVFTREGELVASAEDVGRHNAVDKVLGRLLRRNALPLSNHILCVSGRASFELVQKAIVAGMPMLVAVSAPSSAAIDLARERRLTLAGFVRGDGFNIYTHPHRIV